MNTNISTTETNTNILATCLDYYNPLYAAVPSNSFWTFQLTLLPFPENPAFSWCVQSRTTSVSTFLSTAIVQAWFDLGLICLPFWQSRIFTTLSSNIIFQINQFFLLVVSYLNCPALWSWYIAGRLPLLLLIFLLHHPFFLFRVL